MRSLLFGVFRLTLLAALTFGFVVLFEHGSSKFIEGARAEWDVLVHFVKSGILKREQTPPGQKGAKPAPSSAGSSSSEASAGRTAHDPAQATQAQRH